MHRQTFAPSRAFQVNAQGYSLSMPDLLSMQGTSLAFEICRRRPVHTLQGGNIDFCCHLPEKPRMPVAPPGHRTDRPQSSAPWPAVGAVMEAQVTSVEGDRCFVRLPGGHEGRLDREHSLAYQTGRPLSELPAYAEGQAIKVFIRQHRRDKAQSVFFLHERWAHDNPWSNISEFLGAGDRVTGRVVGTVPGLHGDAHIVQLDAAAPVCDADAQPYEWADGQRQGLVLQPDIEIAVWAEDMPAADGSTEAVYVGGQIGGASRQRFKLEPGDPVAALMLDVNQHPPNRPTASILALLHHQDVAQAKVVHPYALAPTGKAGGMSRAVHRLQLEQRHDAWAEALQGQRILILDDSPHARETMATVLRNYGARVTLLVPPNEQAAWVHQDLVACLAQQLHQAFDLLLLDDGLPAGHDGERALREVLSPAGTNTVASASALAATGDGLRRMVLMSANTEATEWPQARLQALGVWGAVRRPLAVAAICDLLVPEAAARWEWAPPGTAVFDAAGLPSHPAQDLRRLMRMARHEMQQDYAALLSVSASGELGWVTASGKPPFHARDLSDIAKGTRMRELIDGVHSELVLQHGTQPVGLIRPTAAHVGRWFAVRSPGQTRPSFLVGVGSDKGHDCSAAWPLFCYATQAKLESMQWHGAVERHAAALAAGWMAQGHAHETYTALEALQNFAQQLQDALRRGRAAGGFVPVVSLEAIAEGVTWETDGLLGTAHRLLRRQRSRSQPLHLPTWAEQLQASLRRQCIEANVTLHLQVPPDVTLAVPEMVLSIAVANLVLNSAKHHYRQENRWVQVQLWLRQADGALVCDVRDNGPGLSQDVLGSLFEPGQSYAHDPHKRHGIGLWLSRTLLGQEGGSLTMLANQRCLGCTFRIVLPTLTETLADV